MLTAVTTNEGSWIEGDGMPRTLVRMGDSPAMLGAGWVAIGASNFLNAATTLNLRHLDGRTASWILDKNGYYLGGRLEELGAIEKAELFIKGRSQLHSILQSFLTTPDFAYQGEIKSFFDIDVVLRQELVRAVGLPALEMPLPIAAATCQEVQIRTSSGVVPLDVSAVTACLAQSIEERFVEACKIGVMTWPSPVDGAPVKNVRGILLSHILMAWRCVDERYGLVFFVIAAGFSSAALSIWIPSEGKIVVPNSLERGQFSVVQDNQHLTAIVSHLFHFGNDLTKFLSRPVSRFGHYTWPIPAVHVGHYHWNELPGLEKIVLGLKPAEYPIVFDLGGASGNCFYDRITELFPEFGHVVDYSCTNFESLSGFCYRYGIQPIKFSGSLVTRNLRSRISRTIALHPSFLKALDLPSSTPVVIFGLRVENRTIVNLVEFYIHLAKRLADHYGSVVLLVDGHNVKAQGKAEAFGSNQQEKASAKPIEVERRVMKDLLDALRDDRIEIVDCVGMTLRENLAWMNRADFCVAPWGAGLAKYRWALDVPTYILSSQYCMKNKGDMNIYSDSAYTEAPAQTLFVSHGLVTDRPDLPVVIDFGGDSRPYYANFTVDADGATREVLEFMASLGIEPAYKSVERAVQGGQLLPYDAHSSVASVLENFESLGANCEFGFVQKRYDVNVSSLFRWAEVPSINQIIGLIKSDFANLYAFENIEPYNLDMVRDRSNWIAWHSEMKSDFATQEVQSDLQGYVFRLEDKDRYAIYQKEFPKVAYLANKTRESIRSGGRIFVYKPIRDEQVTDEQLHSLQKVLGQHASNGLLYVTVASEPDMVGQVKRGGNGILHGYLDRFAPGNDASDASFDVWTRICRTALAITKDT